MATQFHLPTPPSNAQEINDVVAIVRERGQVAYFASGVPVFVHAEDDAAGQRIAAVQLIELGLAQQDQLSAALAIHRSTLYRQRRKLAQAGVLGVVDRKRGPQGPHRFTVEKQQQVAQRLGAGLSIRQAAAQVGVTEGTIRHALRRGTLAAGPAPAPASGLEGPSARSARAAQATGGVAVERHTERALARMGLLLEAPPHFVAAEAVRYG